jgi:hypothetical protein
VGRIAADERRTEARVSAARTLTDADVALMRELLREVVREELAHRDDKPANGKPKPAAITETMAAAARRELERRGLRAPRRAR